MDSVCMQATDIWKLKGSRQQHVNRSCEDEPRKTTHTPRLINEQQQQQQQRQTDQPTE